MAPKKDKQAKSTAKQTKRNKVWTEDETNSYAEVLCSSENRDRSWLYQLENFEFKKQANEKLFRQIREELEDVLGDETSDDYKFTIHQLRATWPDRPKLFLSYFILQFTSVVTLRRFPVLKFI